jgi:aminoglycoside/choline kinase family phosphotransferase
VPAEQLPRPWARSEALAGDASSRRYARVWDGAGESAIFVSYPEAIRAQLARDLAARSWCADHGLRVPALVDSDPACGWAVVEDLGTTDAAAVLAVTGVEERAELAAQALAPLAVLAALPEDELPPWNPPLDAGRLRWELAGFELWFLRHHRGRRPDPAVTAWLDALAAAVGGHPRRVCHRDYHLNNLFFLPSGEVALIDFQDILIGPDTYDAVSLLHERAMPSLVGDEERGLLARSWATRTTAGPDWELRWRQVRVQRGLKVLGTFARLVAAGRGGYVSWLESLGWELAGELEALAAPPSLPGLLLDW